MADDTTIKQQVEGFLLVYHVNILASLPCDLIFVFLKLNNKGLV